MRGRFRFNTRTYTIITSILLVAILAFIWGNSIIKAEKSIEISNSILNAVEETGIAERSTKNENIIRKYAHLFEFIFLGVILFAFHRGRFSFSQHTLIGLLVALIDETIQLSSEGRSAQITDVWIDMAGFCIGSVVAYLIYKLIQHYRRT